MQLSKHFEIGRENNWDTLDSGYPMACGFQNQPYFVKKKTTRPKTNQQKLFDSHRNLAPPNLKMCGQFQGNLRKIPF